MGFVSSLALSHFRSHQNTTLHLDSRPIAIMGANGSGKTNILEAVFSYRLVEAYGGRPRIV